MLLALIVAVVLTEIAAVVGYRVRHLAGHLDQSFRRETPAEAFRRLMESDGW